MDQILELARMLGVAADELIGYYVQRAPLEWVDFYVSAAFAAIGIVLLVIGIRNSSKREWDTPWVVAVGIGAVIFLAGLITSADAFTEAYKAQKAPQAYAVDEILRNAR